MLTLKIEHRMPDGSWDETLGHACKTDEEAMAYVYRFGVPRPPTFAEIKAVPFPLHGAEDRIFAAASARWREDWAKGPTMRVVSKHGKGRS